MRRALACVAFVAAFLVHAGLAGAQSQQGAGRTETANFTAQPAASLRLTIAAVGDSLGDGLWEGLYRTVPKDKRITVFRGAKNSVGFTGSDLTEQIDAAFAAGPVDALAIMIGANDDRRSFFVNGKSVALFGSKAWADYYRSRIERFMDYAGSKNVPLIWVLLPVMRGSESTAAARLTNEIVTQAAQSRAHVTLVSTWAVTADQTGAYMPYFNDLRGVKRLMRRADGVHFTEYGHELLGHMAFTRLLEVSPRFKAVAAQSAETATR
jgi:uncharacterized protein